MTTPTTPLDPERERMADPGHLEEGLDGASPWYLWGPYVAERAWGTVREDYSADGDAWSYFPHDHARSRAYRWNEDGMAGMSDVFGRLCLGLALWNGRDPILKERMFGLANSEGNHGEDAKDYWWYLDALPSGAWLRWRYHYPQSEFPYDELIRVNGERSKLEGEYELLDTGVFDAGYWVVEVDYAKADPTDILMRIRIKNAGPAADTLHVLPTLWFRNTWSWGDGTPRPSIIATDQGRSLFATHQELGDYALDVGPHPDGTMPTLLFCENETNIERLYGQAPSTPFPKDGINDHVVHGADTVAHGAGTKAAAWYQVTLEPGASAEIRLRLRPTGDHVASDPLGAAFGEVMHTRQLEADAFYAGLARDGMPAEEARIMRQAFAGMLWCKQFYAYNVGRWLAGDLDPPPAARRHGRNAGWDHVDSLDILSMPEFVGVPMVRRMGPCVPRGHSGPHRPCLREVPAARPVPGVVPASRRRPARLRMVVRRRQPAGPRAVGARRLGDRRKAGHRVPPTNLPQAPAELHVVVEPRGLQRRRPVLGRLPRARQPECVRPLQSAVPGSARAVRRDRLDVRVLHVDAPDGVDPDRA